MRRRLLGAALPLALVLVPAAALAVNLRDAGGVSYRFQAKHAAANPPADAAAACPKKKSPTGGGYQFSGDRGMPLDQPAASKPFDGPDPDNRPDDGWEVRGQVNDGAS